MTSKDVARSIDDEVYKNYTQIQKDKATKLSNESQAYQTVGRKCFFCYNKITKKDASPPRQVYTSVIGVAHGDCLKYVMSKYPNRNILDFEGKVVRMRVEGSNL